MRWLLLGSALTPVVFFDLAEDDQDFVTSEGNLNWEWGVPSTGPGGSEAVWATRLDGSYLHDSTDSLEVPMPSLGNTNDPVLNLRHYYELGSGDAARIEVDVGAGWTTVEPIYGYPSAEGFSGSSSGWKWSSVDLAGLGDDPRLRLVLDADVSGADDGWYVSDVAVFDGDATPPRINALSAPEDTEDVLGPYAFELEVEDDDEVVDVALYVDVGLGFERVEASALGDGTWEAELEGQPSGTQVEWFALAHDTEQSGRWPTDTTASFLVELPAPTALRAIDERLAGDDVTLAWDPPESSFEIMSYVLEEFAASELIEVEDTEAVVPVTATGTGIWTVAAVFDVGEGSPSEPLVLEMVPPELERLSPSAAYAGEQVWLDLGGQGLYLQSDTAALDLGPGVTVSEIDVRDVASMRALLTLDEEMAPGVRDVTVTGSFDEMTFADAFTVLDGADRPQITGVVPARVRQGDTVALEVFASEDFAGDVSVEVPEGLLLSGDVATDGVSACFEVVVANTAALGERLLVIDDGVRLWEVTLTVERRIITNNGCGALSGGPGPLPISLALVAVAWRRRRSALD